MAPINFLKRKRNIFIYLLLVIVLCCGYFLPVDSYSKSLTERRSRHAITKVSSRRFWIDDDKFMKDGKPFQIIGGDMHYFRIHPEYWQDRLLRAKALGLNAIQTYVPWNLHEPQPQKWVFDGFADLEAFLRLANKLDFVVMLRVGPYICAEWDFGGFPAWLLSLEKAPILRSSDQSFLFYVKRWWDVLLPKIAPLAYVNGGPIVMVQIENEYGSYGDDKLYLHSLVNMAKAHLSDDIILYTTDGGSKDLLDKGTISGDGIFSTVDFSPGGDPWPIFSLQKKYNAPGKSPPLCSEFYTGWLTHWGEHFATTDAHQLAASLEKILSGNASVVLYMAHGGTNFGLLNGANTGQNISDYEPDITSYDYDAPIKENGDIQNPKFKALQAVIRKYRRFDSLVPAAPETGAYGLVRVYEVASFADILSLVSNPIVQSYEPIPMESLGQMFGFSVHVTDYQPKDTESILSIQQVHDRAQVFISCKGNSERAVYVGAAERWLNRELTIPSIPCSSDISLSILVENMGRVNYGPFLSDKKGILSDVILDGAPLHGWKSFPISFDHINKLLDMNPVLQHSEGRIVQVQDVKYLKESETTADSSTRGLTVHVGHFSINESERVKDTYISFRGWNKGICFVNGFNLGRFWPHAGPQCNLYVPAPLLRHGQNQLIIVELEEANPNHSVNLVGEPDFTCGSNLRMSSVPQRKT